MKTIVDLRDDQVAALDALRASGRISRAEAVRQAVDVYLREYTRERFRKAFGGWRHMKLDGLEYTHAIRQEWDERERRLRPETGP